MADPGPGDGEELALQQLRQLVQDEEDLNIGNPIDERVLKTYLNFTNNNVNKALEKLKLWYKLKAENGEFYSRGKISDHQLKILKKGIHQLLDNRDQLGRRIYLLRLKRLEYGTHSPQQMFQTDDLWLTLAADEEDTQRHGIVMILDLEGFPWRYLRYFTPAIVRPSAAKAENVPLRHIQYHVLNAGLFLNAVMKLVFPFLSQDTKESIHFHKSLESLHTHVSPKYLPEEYGGDQPPADSEKLIQEYLMTRQQRLEELLSYGYTTSNRT